MEELSTIERLQRRLTYITSFDIPTLQERKAAAQANVDKFTEAIEQLINEAAEIEEELSKLETGSNR